MNSPTKINYEIRPFKFTERKMLLAALSRICNYYGDQYQYVGFGGLTFTDFKLFHKELHINKLISIEGGKFNIKKLKFNAPYSFIRIIKANSPQALSEIDLTEKSLVWLDYDDALSLSIFEDIRLLFSKLPIGSVYIMSCNRELKSNETGKEYTKDQFKEVFGDLVPFEIENSAFTSENNYKTIRKMIQDHISKIIRERNHIEEPVRFNQLFNILYQESRGAKMFTYGGVITENNSDIENVNVSDLEFINIDEQVYKIEIPNLTRKETELINDHLFNHEDELLKLEIITESDLRKYKKSYKYMPHYYDVRL